MHWIFGSRKYIPRRAAQQCVQVSPLPQPSSLRHVTHVQYSALSFCSVTAHAQVHSNNVPTRNVYVMLVYLYLFAVALLCCDMLWYSWTGQCWSNFYTCYIFVHVHLMFPYTESSFLFISHWFMRSDEHYYAIISLYEWMTKTQVFLYHTYTDRNVKLFTATRQHFEDSAAEIFVQQNVHTTTTKMMKTYFFKEWSHNLSNMFEF